MSSLSLAPVAGSQSAMPVSLGRSFQGQTELLTAHYCELGVSASLEVDITRPLGGFVRGHKIGNGCHPWEWDDDIVNFEQRLTEFDKPSPSMVYSDDDFLTQAAPLTGAGESKDDVDEDSFLDLLATPLTGVDEDAKEDVFQPQAAPLTSVDEDEKVWQDEVPAIPSEGCGWTMTSSGVYVCDACGHECGWTTFTEMYKGGCFECARLARRDVGRFLLPSDDDVWRSDPETEELHYAPDFDRYDGVYVDCPRVRLVEDLTIDVDEFEVQMQSLGRLARRVGRPFRECRRKYRGAEYVERADLENLNLSPAVVGMILDAQLLKSDLCEKKLDVVQDEEGLDELVAFGADGNEVPVSDATVMEKFLANIRAFASLRLGTFADLFNYIVDGLKRVVASIGKGLYWLYTHQGYVCAAVLVYLFLFKATDKVQFFFGLVSCVRYLYHFLCPWLGQGAG